LKDFITEPARNIPVIAETDICIAGGSCTGVFAAIRAARLGAKVLLIERQNCLGGVAVSGLVNIWHTLMDISNKRQIISGLTEEVIDRLYARGALTKQNARSSSYNFNPCELTVLLDRMTAENKVKVMLHTSYSAVVREGDKVKAVIIENKDGRQAIRAKFFIDATGDGDIARDLGISRFVHEYIQPPTAVFHLQGNMDGVSLRELIEAHGKEFGLDDDWGWNTHVAGVQDITMCADNHVFGVRCDRADDLTAAEIEGRRRAMAFVDMVKAYGRSGEHYAMTNLCSYIGIRETVHYDTVFRAIGRDLLLGREYEAPILHGTYPVDIHHQADNGITFRYLDGFEQTIYGKGTRTVNGNWREREGLTGEPAQFYSVPFDILVCRDYRNFTAAGRMINADADAFGALRVMVNLNQLGEAAGTAAALCLDSGCDQRKLNGRLVTAALNRGGSAL